MGRDVDTIVTAMKAILCPYHFELDPDVPPLPFNTEVCVYIQSRSAVNFIGKVLY